jgi:hypothetical protein
VQEQSHTARRLKILPVYWSRIQRSNINTLKATHVYHAYCRTILVRTGTESLYAAGRAELMADLLRVETVFGEGSIRSEKGELIRRHEAEDESLAPAIGTVTGDDLLKIDILDLELHRLTMA